MILSAVTPLSAAGVTNVLFVGDEKSSRDGAIVDADIENEWR
jgi:hypothetical protein